MKKCNSCEKTFEIEGGFCPFCGSGDVVELVEATVSPEKSFCSGCGSEMEAGAVFCTSCGKKFTDSVAEQAPDENTSVQTAPSKKAKKEKKTKLEKKTKKGFKICSKKDVIILIVLLVFLLLAVCRGLTLRNTAGITGFGLSKVEKELIKGSWIAGMTPENEDISPEYGEDYGFLFKHYKYEDFDGVAVTCSKERWFYSVDGNTVNIYKFFPSVDNSSAPFYETSKDGGSYELMAVGTYTVVNDSDELKITYTDKADDYLELLGSTNAALYHIDYEGDELEQSLYFDTWSTVNYPTERDNIEMSSGFGSTNDYYSFRNALKSIDSSVKVYSFYRNTKEFDYSDGNAKSLKYYEEDEKWKYTPFMFYLDESGTEVTFNYGDEQVTYNYDSASKRLVSQDGKSVIYKNTSFSDGKITGKNLELLRQLYHYSSETTTGESTTAAKTTTKTTENTTAANKKKGFTKAEIIAAYNEAAKSGSGEPLKKCLLPYAEEIMDIGDGFDAGWTADAVQMANVAGAVSGITEEFSDKDYREISGEEFNSINTIITDVYKSHSQKINVLHIGETCEAIIVQTSDGFYILGFDA